ncbi:Aldehyde dehydrogenase family protein [Planctomycetes bacterium Poly30]|uniref:Aldehyde dehydrogenase family protein n=1 Tax=Saltatorellus ferox TaxID=2528018 RepID=A0A518EX52_9BACT|nr:Aldehyde dehydrogenase family protein [Planctomycetes bacterium Poly30]
MIPWPDPTPTSACNEALEHLRAHATAWVELTLTDRIALLEELEVTVAEAASEWVHISAEAKGLGASPDVLPDIRAEEWLAGPWTVLRHLQLQGRALRDIQVHGAPRLPGTAREAEDGRVKAPVFPTDPLDRILFRGMSAEVWMERGVELEHLEETMGWMHRPGGKGARPGITVVLGAGNHSCIGPLDTLFELFARGHCVILKTNPVNAYLGPAWERAFAPLIRKGVLRIVHGGATTGEYLCEHDAVDHIHITGSDRTFDAIVWGTGKEGQDRKRTGEKRVRVPITSELGNVSPVIAVPGPWSASDLAFQASNIASSLVNNSGFNCLATRVIVTAKAWDQRRAFLDAVGRSLEAAPTRPPYYPGAQLRHRDFLAAHPNAKRFGAKGREANGIDTVGWTLIEDVDPTKTDDICFQTESWCGLMAETALEGEDPVDFLRNATEFCNDVLWGTLNATILVHPTSMRDPRIARAVEDAIGRLRYGTVSLNLWAGAAFAICSTPWGAFPGHKAEDIRSGQGFVHNTYLFERPEKTVVRAPFRIWPRPVWFHDTKHNDTTARRLFDVTTNTTAWRMARLAWSAARG